MESEVSEDLPPTEIESKVNQLKEAPFEQLQAFFEGGADNYPLKRRVEIVHKTLLAKEKLDADFSRKAIAWVRKIESEEKQIKIYRSRPQPDLPPSLLGEIRQLSFANTKLRSIEWDADFSSLIRVCANSPQLETLRIHKTFMLGSFSSLSPHLTHLTKLIIDHCRFTNADFAALYKLDKLTALSINGFFINITDINILEDLGKNCKELKKLSMEEVWCGTPEAFRTFFVNYPGLTWLNTARNSVDSEGLIEISKQCKQLEYIDLSYCTAYSGEALKTFAANCAKCKTLILKGCKQLSPQAIIDLVKTHQGLTLNLVECSQFTPQDIAEIAKWCKVTAPVFQAKGGQTCVVM